MRLSLASATALVIALAAAVALAQPRGGAAGKARPMPDLDAAPSDAAPPDAGSASALVTEPNASGKRMSPLTPASAEFPTAVPKSEAAPGLSAAAPEYERLVAETIALRARVAAAGDSLYRARISISLRGALHHTKLTRLRILLDGGTVYASDLPSVQDAKAMLYERGIAAGKHSISVSTEHTHTADASFTSATQMRYTIDVPRDRTLEVDLRLDEDSDMAAEFPRGGSGSYDVRARLNASTRK